MGRACSSCGGPACPDNFRGLTVHVDNSARLLDDGDLCESVELCPGNRVYAYELAAHWTNPNPENPAALPPEILATWKLSDSTIALYSLGCVSGDLRANMPGICLPASSKVCAAPGVELALVITYGECLNSVCKT